MVVAAGGIYCDRVGFGCFVRKERNTHREREEKKKSGKDEIDNKKELKNNKEIIF